jgi:hypothetical protein
LFFTLFQVIITGMELDDIREAYPEAIAIVEMAETVWGIVRLSLLSGQTAQFTRQALRWGTPKCG